MHIHHYCIGMFAMTFLCYQSAFITLAHSIFNGITIEGGSRWGYDPVFVKDDVGPKKSSKQEKDTIEEGLIRQNSIT